MSGLIIQLKQFQVPNNAIYIIVPVFNESAIIKTVIEDLSRFNYTIVIIDDGSDIKIKSLAESLSGVIVIRHRVNLGQGAAIQTGIQYAIKNNADFIVTFDGDGQHSVEDIPAMLSPLKTGIAEITIGSRFLQKSNHNAPTNKRLLLKLGRWVNYIFTGIFLSDSHNGLRAMTSEAAKKIDLKENRMAHASEFLFLIRKNKLKYREVPVTVRYTKYSRSKGQSAFNSIRIFFDLVLHKLFE